MKQSIQFKHREFIMHLALFIHSFQIQGHIYYTCFHNKKFIHNPYIIYKKATLDIKVVFKKRKTIFPYPRLISRLSYLVSATQVRSMWRSQGSDPRTRQSRTYFSESRVIFKNLFKVKLISFALIVISVKMIPFWGG